MTTSANTATARKISSASAGALVWWDFESVAVTSAVMSAIVLAHGMENQISVPVIDAESAIRKTASSFTAGRDSKTRVRAKVVGVYDDGSVEVALVEDYARKGQRSGDGKAGANQIDSVVFDKNSGSWLYSGTTDAAKRFIEQADHARMYLGHDFVRSNVVHGPLRLLGAFPLRRRLGGFYFVPKQNEEAARKIAAIVHDIPSDCEVAVVGITSDDASQQEIGKAARSYLNDQIGSLKQRLAAWKEATRSPRSDAVGNAIAEFSEIKAHAALYRDALNLELADLNSEMEGALAQAEQIAGLIEDRVAPHFVTTVISLVSAYGLGNEISYGDIESTGVFPSHWFGEERARWWNDWRGYRSAVQAGYKSVGSETGVTFTPATENAAPAGETDEPTPEPQAPEGGEEVEAAGEATPEVAPEVAPESAPEVAPEIDEAAELVAQIQAMTKAQLVGAIELVTGSKPSSKAKVEDLRHMYADAVGVGSLAAK